MNPIFRPRRRRGPVLSLGPAAVLLALVAALSLAACSSTKKDELAVAEKPVEQLYNDAMDALMNEDYDQAAKLFDEVDRQHPYSVWATKGQLMSAFTHYREGKYTEAVVTLEHFIELHPAHENVDYAYYLRALCFYERITDVSRDQQMTEKAKADLEEIVSRFPDSNFAADAKGKLVLVRDQLAGKEMEIGRYYETRGHYLAAINRFSTVVKDYGTTSHVQEALHRLTECYLALGVVDAAERNAAVLGYNFPGSAWYKDSYNLLSRGDYRVASAERGAAAPPPGAKTGAKAPPKGGAEPDSKAPDDDRSFFSRTWDWIF